MAELFLDAVALLEPYYFLVEKVNSLHELTEEDLASVCTPLCANEVIKLQKLYNLSGKLRSCGNPSFVHSLRTFIWAQAFQLPPQTTRIVLSHDVVEDFGKTYQQIRAMLERIPNDIRLQIKLLTNQYKVIAKELAPYDSLAAMKKKIVTFYHEDDVVPQKIFSLLGNLPEGINLPLYLKDNAYRLYVEDILESGDESVLVAKFIDRLDNTLTDLPSKFDAILKLYDKNMLLLTLTQETIAQTKNVRLQLIYLLLFERFLDQSTALRRRYDHIAKVRGKFYGKQYSKLSRDLRARHKELEKLQLFADKLYASKKIERLLEQLKRKYF
ncbi:hypothetical protein K9M74_01405 [Candidatus Woesearchaeota archaeon]|nr:hypothetical protein [Candidatus Woesearchaeota archaeon]